MAVDKNGSKMDGIVKLVIIGFVCLLSFAIGTFVGKKFSDNQHKVAQFEPNENEQREPASVQPESGEVKPSEALSDDEVAKLAEEFVSDEGKEGEAKEGTPMTDKNSEVVREAKNEAHGEGEAHGAKKAEHGEAKEKSHAAEAPAAKHGEKSAHAEGEHHGSNQPLNAASKVARDENPEKVEKTVTHQSRIPSSLPKQLADSSNGKYTVQVASYPTEQEAQKMAADLKAKKFSAFYVTAKIKDRKTNTEKTWYRVSVGLFATQKEAEAYKQDLLNHAKVASAYVQKINE